MHRVRAAAAKPRRGKAPMSLGSKRLSVIIPVLNERQTLPSVIREARKLGAAPQEIIVVINGSTDGSGPVAESMGVKVISYEEPLGHDVGRSIGARHATGDILLFLDGDMVIPAAQLRPFIRAVQRGTDIALNRYLGPVRSTRAHPVVLAKHALNAALGRFDLKGASMTAVPHAISRRALERIGAEALCVPPVAQAMAVERGLRLQAVHLVGVGRLNRHRHRPVNSLGMDRLGQLIIGDHLEAVRWFAQASGDRGRYGDAIRIRETVR